METIWRVPGVARVLQSLLVGGAVYTSGAGFKFEFRVHFFRVVGFRHLGVRVRGLRVEGVGFRSLGEY